MMNKHTHTHDGDVKKKKKSKPRIWVSPTAKEKNCIIYIREKRQRKMEKDAITNLKTGGFSVVCKKLRKSQCLT